VRKNSKAHQERPAGATIRILLLITLLLVVGLLLLAAMVGGKFGPLHQITLDFIGPMQSVVTRTATGIANLKSDYLDLLEVREENKKLQAQIDKYLTELGEYREGYSTYLHLQELLEMQAKLTFKPIAARVVGKEPSYWYQTIVVDRGRKDDILEGMIALAPGGVVGQVMHTAENYSKILLANAPSSAIDAMVQKNRTRGILKGAGEKGYILQYVLKSADVEVGDHIVTAGIGGIFPPGIPLGRISKIEKKQRGMFQEIEVEPYIDFQKLEYVLLDPTDRKSVLDSMNMVPTR
jgi:rod shape-determining protein MreC